MRSRKRTASWGIYATSSTVIDTKNKLGPPGSGKTSTAETIAAYTGRPLYSITCGDIGTKPKELEMNLIKHTRLAERWGCVLLLDEADVFPMSRTYDDLHRNAMVSIFLRQLEHYSGILFLTTNIVGIIDEAFKSRIHIALEYPAVDEKSTLEIWGNLLQRIKRDNKQTELKIKFDEQSLLKFAKHHFRKHQRYGTTWNGRQIRNAFQTAISIGQYDRLKKISEAQTRDEEPDKSTRYIRLSIASFEIVAETASDFEKYITKTRGNDQDRAAINRFRNDEHSREPPPRKPYAHTSVRKSNYQNVVGSGSSWEGRLTQNANRRNHEDSDASNRLRTSKGTGSAKKPRSVRHDDYGSRRRSEPSHAEDDNDISNEEIFEDDSDHDED